MLEFVFELLFQFLIEVVGEALLHIGFQGAAAVVRSRVARYITGIAVGFGAGALWGDILADQGASHRPRLFWVSLAIGTVAAVVAALRVRSGEPITDDQPGWLDVLLPWRWPAFRLIGFSLMNVALAAGIAVGYTPPHIPR